MNFQQATGRTITESFELFHQLNPSVYDEVKKLAFAALNKGRKKISFKLIINVEANRTFATPPPSAVK